MASLDNDWSAGPAKWCAVVVLGALGAGALGWTLGRGSGERFPLVIAARESAPVRAAPSEPVARPTEPAPRQQAAPVLEAVPETPKTQTRAPEAAPVLTKKINLNTGTAAELELLPGIGPALALRIIEYRESRGRFASIDELDAVKGIGPKLMARVRDHITVEEAPASPSGAGVAPD